MSDFQETDFQREYRVHRLEKKVKIKSLMRFKI